MNRKRDEKGQVLVLIILAIVGMFGFAALAVDIGRVFSERRRAQNAADSAALVAAYAGTKVDVVGSNLNPRRAAAQAAAIDSLDINNYVDEGTINIDDGLPIEISFNLIGTDSYQVIIYQDVEKIFSHFIFGGLLDFTVEAIASVPDTGGTYNGNSIIATSPDDCDALTFSGNSYIVIKNSGVVSRSKMTGQQATCLVDPQTTTEGASCVSAESDGTTKVVLDEGFNMTLHGKWKDSSEGGLIIGGVAASPAVCQPTSAVPTLPEPICGASVAKADIPAAVGGVIFLQPGTYNYELNDQLFKKDTVQLSPGLYCLNGGLNIGEGEVIGDAVVFYVPGELNGAGYDEVNFILTTKVTVNLQAATDLKGARNSDGSIDNDFQWGGMLLYMPPTNGGIVDIGAQANVNITGTIFAPGPATQGNSIKCSIGAGSQVGKDYEVNSSIICDTIKVGGGATMNIKFNADDNFPFKDMLSLTK